MGTQSVDHNWAITLDAGAYRFPTGLLFEGADSECYLATFFDGTREGDSFTGWEVASVTIEPDGITFGGVLIALGKWAEGFLEVLAKGEGR